jgi:hypothetical protein
VGYKEWCAHGGGELIIAFRKIEATGYSAGGFYCSIAGRWVMVARVLL